MVGVRSILTKQHISDFHKAFGGGSVQRCCAVHVLGIHFGAVLKQQFRNLSNEIKDFIR